MRRLRSFTEAGIHDFLSRQPTLPSYDKQADFAAARLLEPVE